MNRTLQYAMFALILFIVATGPLGLWVRVTVPPVASSAQQSFAETMQPIYRQIFPSAYRNERR